MVGLSRVGREIYYRNGNKLMAAEISFKPTPDIGNRRMLFTTDQDIKYLSDPPGQTYDVAPDGKFLFMKLSRGSPVTQLHLIQNWFEELNRICPIK